MNIVGSNAAGLLNKTESFMRNISLFNAGVYFVQETKAPRKGKIKLMIMFYLKLYVKLEVAVDFSWQCIQI